VEIPAGEPGQIAPGDRMALQDEERSLTEVLGSRLTIGGSDGSGTSRGTTLLGDDHLGDSKRAIWEVDGGD
jgi:hypothetical protein